MKMKLNVLLLAVAAVVSSVLSTQGRELHNAYFMCMCAHITNYVASDPCFRSASSYHVVRCDISCLLCSCDVQGLVVQGTKCWDRYCSHTTLHFNPSLVHFLPYV